MHTPDGAPCGLLNHLTAGCKITTDAVPAPNRPAACASLGMVPGMSGGHVLPTVYGVQYIPVFFNGRLLGRVLLGGDCV